MARDEEFEPFVHAQAAHLLWFALAVTGDRSRADSLTRRTLIDLGTHWPDVVRDHAPLAYAHKEIVRRHLGHRHDAEARRRASAVLCRGYGLWPQEAVEHLGFATEDDGPLPPDLEQLLTTPRRQVNDPELVDRVIATVRRRRRSRFASVTVGLAAVVIVAAVVAIRPPEPVVDPVPPPVDMDTVDRLVAPQPITPGSLATQVRLVDAVVVAEIAAVTVPGAFSDDGPYVVDPDQAGYQTIAITLYVRRVLKPDGEVRAGDNVLAIINVSADEDAAALDIGFSKLDRAVVLLGSGRAWPLADYAIYVAGGGMFPLKDDEFEVAGDVVSVDEVDAMVARQERATSR